VHITRLLRNTLLGVSAAVAFAVAPASASDAALRDTVYNDALPMTQRVDAMRELTGLGKAGNDTRKICIWDIVGRKAARIRYPAGSDSLYRRAGDGG